MRRLLWSAIALTAAYQPTPKERVYAEMRRHVSGIFGVARFDFGRLARMY